MEVPQLKFDLSFLNKISGGDRAFIVEMINTFKEQVPEFIQNSQRFLKEKNYESLSREAHKFLPGVAFLGIRELEPEVALIEEYAKKRENIDQLEPLLSSAIAKINEIIISFDKEFGLS